MKRIISGILAFCLLLSMMPVSALAEEFSEQTLVGTVEEAMAEETAPEETVSEETAPQESVPEETVSEETAPEESVPEASVPEETVPEETELEETVPEETEFPENPTEDTSATEAVEETEADISEVTVYYHNAQAWDAVYVYIQESALSDNSFPGVLLEESAENENWYAVTVLDDDGAFTCAFNDGQTQMDAIGVSYTQENTVFWYDEGVLNTEKPEAEAEEEQLQQEPEETEEVLQEKDARTELEPEAPVAVTRAQWIQQLVATFEMTVEEDNYPDNYYSDLTGEEEYYRDIMVAVEFGVIDLEAGLPFFPQAAATREFAAHTLNFALGFQLGAEAVYTFAEAAEVTYPSDIQIAINRGWFALTEGKFLPEQAITLAESAGMINDAAQVLAADVIAPDHDNNYGFAEGVIVLPDDSVAQLNSATELVIANPETAIKQGDIFAINLDGIPVVYSADAVAVSGELYTITVTQLDVMSYLNSIDAEGSLTGDLAKFEIAEGLEAIYVLEDGSRVRNLKAAGSKKIKNISIYETIGNVTVNLEVYNMKLDWRAKGNVFDKTSIDVSAVVSGKMYSSISVAFGASVSDFTDELVLGTYPIGSLGSVTVVADISIDGSVTVTYGANFKTGVAYSYYGGFRIPQEFKKTHFSITVEASIDFGLTAKAGIYGVPFVSAQCSATVGMRTNFVAKYREAKPRLCIHTDTWIYAKASVSASVGIDTKLPGGENFKESWSENITIWDRNTSPVRSVSHYEDGTMVSECTYGETNFFGYSTKYYSPSGSSYANGGVSAVVNVPTYTYTTDDEGNATITGFNGGFASISIPATIDGYPVTAIGENAFKGHSSLVSVTLPGSIVSIAAGAFYKCTGLKSIVFSQKLTEIDRNAFLDCVSLVVVDIPDSVTFLGGYAFSGCTNLRRVTLSANLTEMEQSVFQNCIGLTQITIPKTLTACSGNNYLKYTYGIFYGCSNLKQITLEEGMTRVPEYLLQGSAIEEITIPESVTSLGRGCFRGCQELTGITVPDAVTVIEGYAFEDCSSLKNVVLSRNLTEMEHSVFRNCIGLTQITIPKTLTACSSNNYLKDSYGIFYGCSNLKQVEIESGRTSLPDYLMQGSSIETITVPEGVTSIGAGCFRGCTELKEIVLPANLKSMGRYIFENSGFEEFTLPDSVTEIGDGAFKDAAKLKTFTWNKTISSIPAYTFKNCPSLETISISEHVTRLMKQAFRDCIALNEVKLPEQLTEIDNGCFYNADSLTAIAIPAAVTRIGDDAFYDSDALTSIQLPDALTTLNHRAFYDCDALETVILGDGLTKMGDEIFYHCDVLKHVTLGKNLTAISKGAFQLCAELEEIVIPYYVTAIGNDAFNSSPKLVKAVLPRGLNTIGTNAFPYADTTVIYGVPGTFAEVWATGNKFRFVAHEVAATEISLNKTALTIHKGASEALELSVVPGDFTDSITWKSGDTSIVTVSDRGVLKAVGVGTATVKVTVGSCSASCKVTVLQPVTSINLNKTKLTLQALETFQLKATPRPDNANDPSVTWESSDPAVATVNDTGFVTAVSKGTAVITVAAQDGSGVKNSCTVTVSNTAYTVTDPTLLESPHNYPDNCTDFWIYTAEDALRLEVLFDPQTEMEDGFDYLKLFDGEGNLLGTYTGMALAGQTVTVAGDTVRIQLQSDESGNEWGFKVTQIHAAMEELVYNGSCGEKLSWIFDPDTGCLTISGTGEMEDWGEDYPWKHLQSKITAVVVDSQVTSLGSGAFAGCTAVKEITFLGDAPVIGKNAFRGIQATAYYPVGWHVDSMNGYGGSLTWICAECKNGHTEVIDKGTAPGCTEDGLSDGRHCSVCGEVLAPQEILPATGHTEVTDAALEPTCTEAGLTEGKHCSVCQEILIPQERIPAPGHKPGAEATCTAAQVCTVCNAELAPALGHDLIRRDETPATCTEPGYQAGAYCSRCDYTEAGGEIPPLGHNEVIDAPVAPTCTEAGLTEGKHCDRCGEVLTAQEEVPATGHTEAIAEAIAPTCTEPGLTEGKICSVCQEILVPQEEVPAPGHIPGEEATCETAQVCTVCGEELSPALGHDLVRKDEIPATCTEPGYQAGAYCSRCDYTEAGGEIPALGHNEVIDKARPATCTKDGVTEGKHCDRCGEILIPQETIPATGHEFEEGFCLICGASDKADFELISGKSLSLKIRNPETGKNFTSKQITFSLDEEYDAFATLSPTGKLTAKKVFELTRIEFQVTVLSTGETLTYTADLYPALTQLEVQLGEAVLPNNASVPMDFGSEPLTFRVNCYPEDTLENVEWSISDKNGQYAEYTVDGDRLTVSNPTGKAATVTVKASVNAGSKKTVTFKLQLASYAKTVRIEAPQTTVSGGESLKLTASITSPEEVTKPGIVWSVSDKTLATISGGTLKAKNLSYPATVTVTATSRDGQASDSIDIRILPKKQGQLVLMLDGRYVTGKTVSLNAEDVCQLEAYTILDGEIVGEDVTWSSAKPKTAEVDGSGLVTALASGTAKITAKSGSMTAYVNLKVTTLASDIEITTKDGKNLIEEDGETVVILPSGKSAALAATVQPKGASKAVTWEIIEGGNAAKLTSSGKLTANKDQTRVTYVQVRATAKDGSGCYGEITVKVLPLANGVQIFESGNRVRSNTVYVSDLENNPVIHLSARVYPFQALQEVEFTSSNKKVAYFDEFGDLICLGTGSTNITATAQDGSKQKATFKLTVVNQVADLSLKEELPLDAKGDVFIAGGKSLKLATMVDIYPSNATNKKLTWSVSHNDAGIKVNASGVLSTRKVSEPVTVNIMAVTQDGSGEMLSFDVTVYPATTKLTLRGSDRDVTGKVLILEENESIDLTALSKPENAANVYTWQSSNEDSVYVDDSGTVTALQTGKVVTVTCKAADGSGKSATVKIKVS